VSGQDDREIFWKPKNRLNHGPVVKRKLQLTFSGPAREERAQTTRSPLAVAFVWIWERKCTARHKWH